MNVRRVLTTPEQQVTRSNAPGRPTVPGRKCRVRIIILALCGLTLISPIISTPARAEEALIAVATNFAEIVRKLETRFEAASQHELNIVTGSTGKLFTQVTLGAPFDAFLAADSVRPKRLETEKFAVPGTRFTYAIGRLTLWSPDPQLLTSGGPATLRDGHFRHIAIANPDLAPYGLAARQLMQHLGVEKQLSGKIVMGENAGQAFSMVATGNAEMGFVPRSYVTSPKNVQTGSHWHVPPKTHDPIRQDAVLLNHGAKNSGAIEFLAFLRSAEARNVLKTFGYGVD